jgi:hypothetical protein
MSCFAEMHDEEYGRDDGMGRSDPEDYLKLSDEEIRRECAKARDAKIVSIRDWPNKLSEKQRYCLAVWCARRDDWQRDRLTMQKK